jgi:hypothetical protein
MKKRTTTITWGGLSYEADVERHWECLLADPVKDQLATVADGMHWLTVLPWLSGSKDQRNKFWSIYDDAEAGRMRLVATYGLAATNYAPDRDFLNLAAMAHDNRQEAISPATGTEKKQKASWSEMALLGLQFAEMIAKRDHNRLLRLSQIVKAGGTPIKQDKDKLRGGPKSPAGKMFRQFVLLHIKSRELPTKKELREACGMDVKTANKVMKSLGLLGLPQASPTKI